MSSARWRPVRRRILGHALTIVVVLGGVACGGGDADGGGAPSPTTAPATARPSSTAQIEIVSPAQDQTVSGTKTTLDVKLDGATIVPQTTTDLQPDEGHLHVFMDGELVSMTSGAESELTGLTPGRHLLKVEFVANDHAPFDPRVIAAISFEVER